MVCPRSQTVFQAGKGRQHTAGTSTACQGPLNSPQTNTSYVKIGEADWEKNNVGLLLKGGDKIVIRSLK